jgi:toxin FitB
MSFLLDTNVVSELRRRSPNSLVVQWFQQVRSEEIYLSVLTLGEIRQGIEQLRSKDPVAAVSLEDWSRGLVATYRDRIVGIDSAIADRWGRLNVPNRVPAIDGLLAATALVKDWTLVTRNVNDIRRTGVRVLNPFEEDL